MIGVNSEVFAELESCVGGIQGIRLLHKPWIRKRESYRPVGKRSPKVYLLTTYTGSKYKLLLSAESTIRIERMINLAEKTSVLSFFPGFVANGKRWLLVDYVEGVVPDFSSPEFSYELGRAMSQVHGVEKGVCNAAAIRHHFECDVRQLQSESLLSRKSELDDIVATVDALNLESFPTSLDYFDVKPGNFIQGEQGCVYFIDQGALGLNRPSGQYLFGSAHYQKLDAPSLFEGYQAGGGDQRVINFAVPLRVLHGIWLAAHYFRRAKEVPDYALPIKYGFKMAARNRVSESARLASLYVGEHEL